MSRISVSAGCALVCAHLLVLGTSGPAQQANGVATPRPILPAAPAELLACLPPAPVRWTMTRSNAASSFTQWITAIANRELKWDPPPVTPNAAGPTTPFVPGLLWVHLTDNGYFTNYTTGFVAPSSGPAKSTTFLKIADHSARKYKPDETTEVLSVLVKGRFVVEIRAKNMLEADLLNYLAQVNCQKLLAIPDVGPLDVPQPVQLTRIDELNPAQNRRHPLYWAKAEQG